MAFLDKILGPKKPTVAAIDAALAEVQGELAAAPGRIAAAEVALQRVADMTETEHAAADAELAAARRFLVRLEAQIADLRQARSAAKKTEAEDALRAERAAVQKRADGMKGLLDRYDAAAKATADAADAIGAVDGEVGAMNRKIEAARRDGLDVPAPIATSRELFRSEPDHVVPDRVETETKWMVPDGIVMVSPGDERTAPSYETRWAPADTLVSRGGEMVPCQAGAKKRTVERTIPGRRRPGRSIDSPLAGLSLPPSRLSGPTHWPRGK